MEIENEKRKLKKKASLIYVLKILENYSHEDRPLTHEDIAQYLLEDYDVELERKAIGKCIDALEDAGYPIERPKGKGTYIDASAGLEDVQVQMMIDSVLANRSISARESKKLLGYLLSLGSAGLREKNWNVQSLNAWGKEEQNSAHYSMDEIQRAIAHRKQIRFMYDDYVMGLHHGAWGLSAEAGKDAPVVASPLRILAKDGHEYLVAVIQWQPHGKLEYRIECFRLELIRNAEELKEQAVLAETVPGYEKGFDPKAFLTAYPSMTTGGSTPITVKFAYQKWDEPVVKKYLGKDAWIVPEDSRRDGEVAWQIATVKMGMEEAARLAMRHPLELVLIHPPQAVDYLKRRLKRTMETYQWAEERFK